MGNKDLYKNSGVDIKKADNLVSWLSKYNKKNKSSLLFNKYGYPFDQIGGFSGLFKLNFKKFKDPILAASTDGVGTKLMLALKYNHLHTIGLDLVAMCVNDLYCIGATPLFFLDYYATGALNEDQFKKVLASIKQGLDLCNTYILGGETAEMPGLYKKGDVDLAGFVVGIVDKSNILGKQHVKQNDVLYAFKSSGFHSNGYSLIRKWLTKRQYPKALIKKLLAPTKIYWQIPLLLENVGYHKTVHAIAHITGGGISGNLSRVIPDGLYAIIEKACLPTPLWMKNFILQNTTSLDDVEHVFNMGVGMICVISKSKSEIFETNVKKLQLDPIKIGIIKKQNKNIKNKVIYE